MKVLAARADNGGCALYRIQQPARAAMSVQPDIEVEVENGLNVEATRDEDGITTVHEIKHDCDVLVIQRPLDNQWVSVIDQAHRQGIAVVVEVDDDLTSVSLRNSFYINVDPVRSPTSNYEWALRAADKADLVTVSTPRLAEVFAPHGRSVVLPNYISRSWIDIDPNPVAGTDRPRIGWTGTTQTHPLDLQETRPGVAQTVRDTDASVRVIGDAEGVRDALGLSTRVDLRDTGWRPLDRYPQAVSDHVDIGIVPLADTPFNHAKSWLKGLEFAALGKPFVASPRTEYLTLANRYGIGVLAATPSEWRRKVGDLVRYPELREAIGATWRRHVFTQLLIEDHGQDWIDAWRLALDYSVRR